MKRTLRLKGIRWDDKFQVFGGPEQTPVYSGVDGAIEYEIFQERTPEELAKILKPGEIAATEQELDRLQATNAPHEAFARIGVINPYAYSFFQPFKRGSTIQINGRNVWGWDGNREAPTLTPSFLMDNGTRDGEQQTRIHLFFTAGKINLLSDSNVQLIN